MMGLAFEGALRSIRKTPGLSLLVITAMALGIGVTMPMVTLYYQRGENPLPDRGDQVHRVLIDNWLADQPFWNQFPDLSTQLLTGVDARALVLSEIPTAQALMYTSLQYLRSDDERNLVQPYFGEVRVTGGDFFAMFGTPFAHGAGWSADDEAAGRNVAVISNHTNTRLFGGGDNVGRTFLLGSEGYTVIGILGPWELVPRVYDLSMPNARTEAAFVPVSDFRRSALVPNFSISHDAELRRQRFDANYLAGETLFANLWVQLDSPAQVQEYRDFLVAHWASQKALGRYQRPMNNQLFSATEWITASPFQRSAFVQYSAFIVTGVFFLIVCLLNTLSLLLAKFLAATPEISVMRALGASRSLVFAQHLMEVAMLGVVGGLAGIGIARLGLVGIRNVYLNNIPREMRDVITSDGNPDAYIGMDANLLALAIALAVGAAVLAALYPAWRACRIPPAEYLKVN